MQMNKTHALIMLACCLIPLAGFVAIWLFKLPASNAVYFGLMLMCPVLHFVMMRNMLKPGQPDQSEHDHAHAAGPLVPVAETKCRPPQLTSADKS